MTGSSSYAEEARKRVGQYLVKEVGYSKKTPKKYYRQGEDILSYVYLERAYLTYVEVGIAPLYIPDAPQYLNGVRLQNCALSEDCSPMQANQWAEKVISQLQSGILSFMESIAAPRELMQYLLNRPSHDSRFTASPLQTDKLIIFTAAYLGNIPFAINHARKAIQNINETQINTLRKKIAKYDAEKAQINSMSEKNGTGSLESIRQLIRNIERDKELAEFNLTHNIPATIQMYEQWTAPLSAPDFDRETYFSRIIRQNKDSLKYEKLFKIKFPSNE